MVVLETIAVGSILHYIFKSDEAAAATKKATADSSRATEALVAANTTLHGAAAQLQSSKEALGNTAAQMQAVAFKYDRLGKTLAEHEQALEMSAMRLQSQLEEIQALQSRVLAAEGALHAAGIPVPSARPSLFGRGGRSVRIDGPPRKQENKSSAFGWIAMGVVATAGAVCLVSAARLALHVYRRRQAKVASSPSIAAHHSAAAAAPAAAVVVNGQAYTCLYIDGVPTLVPTAALIASPAQQHYPMVRPPFPSAAATADNDSTPGTTGATPYGTPAYFERTVAAAPPYCTTPKHQHATSKIVPA